MDGVAICAGNADNSVRPLGHDGHVGSVHEQLSEGRIQGEDHLRVLRHRVTNATAEVINSWIQSIKSANRECGRSIPDPLLLRQAQHAARTEPLQSRKSPRTRRSRAFAPTKPRAVAPNGTTSGWFDRSAKESQKHLLELGCCNSCGNSGRQSGLLLRSSDS